MLLPKAFLHLLRPQSKLEEGISTFCMVIRAMKGSQWGQQLAVKQPQNLAVRRRKIDKFLTLVIGKVTVKKLPAITVERNYPLARNRPKF